MRPGSEIESRLLAPCSFDPVRRFVHADGNGVVRNVRKIQFEIAEVLFDTRKQGIELLDFVADLLHGIDLRGGVLFAFFPRGDLLRDHVALILQPFHPSDGPAPLSVELQESIEIDLHAAILQRGAVLVGTIAKGFARQHGARL